MLDIHAHILPGVDDGAVNEVMTIEMLKAARRAGIDRIVATSHVTRNQSIERCQAAGGHQRDNAKEHGILLMSGCELSVSVLAGVRISPEVLTPFQIGQTQFILLEFPNDVPPVDWEYLVSDIKRVGFHAIIAHPERCRYIARDFSMAKDLISYGCELQLDAQSFLGGRFSSERRTASRLLDGGLASYIASDAHRPGDYDTFQAVRRHLGDHWPADGLLEELIMTAIPSVERDIAGEP